MLHIADHDLGMVFEGDTFHAHIIKDPLKETFQSLMQASEVSNQMKNGLLKVDKPKIESRRRSSNVGRNEVSAVNSETFAFGPIQGS